MIHDNSNGFPTRCSVQLKKKKKKLIQFLIPSTREDTTNCRAKAVPLRDTPTMTIGLSSHNHFIGSQSLFLGLGITATLAKRVGMNLFQAPCLGESYSLQGLSERMAKVKRFLWALNFTKSLKAEVEAEAEVEAPHSQDATG